ncbi:DUF5658 family protein [Psychrobacillus sp. NEAU-3TGS]|uniref:DUF5658 family protein n=1 Tax=Psychrobacillus sp. NEAU-3TGS TaxID=2995412 RepID=UPI0024973917|nr:DUF5658 family protein [Psychrobacillus sp. NEAU-3TGS]MDI2587522.1 DUF5658 family protein [Psychrobacillus sp. NEAU-3TGS]
MNRRILAPTQINSFTLAIFLLILAIFDSIFTDFGIRYGHISEANPFMRFVYENNIAIFYSIKIILPLLFMYIITKFQTRKYMQLLIGFTLLLYTLVLFQHFFWISLLFIL